MKDWPKVIELVSGTASMWSHVCIGSKTPACPPVIEEDMDLGKTSTISKVASIICLPQTTIPH